jgi:hypothetical protein
MPRTTIITLPMFTPGTKSWLESSVEFAAKKLLYIDSDARHFYRKTKELIENKAWELYFKDEPKTWERFLTEALGVRDIEDTLSVLRGVQLAIESGVTGPIPPNMARDQLLVKTTPAVGKHGTNRFSEDRGDSGNVYNQRGNSLTYQAGRLKRDRPDLAKEVEIGNMSLRAATDEAGITKRPPKQWRVPADLKSLATYIKTKFTQDQIAKLINELNAH